MATAIVTKINGCGGHYMCHPTYGVGKIRVTSICTIQGPMCWVSFFTNITIIIIKVTFDSIIKSEGMFMSSVPCGMW